MLWASYGRISKDGVQGMLDNPTDRAEAVGKLVPAYGRKLISYHMLMNEDIDLVVLSVDTSLAKDKTESWEISPEKNPYTLQVSGKSGQIRLKVDQKP